MTAILGVSCFYHDSAAALVREGEIVAAAQEERFTRDKNDARFPAQAIAFCLKEAGLAPEQIDYVAYYEKPVAKFGRLLETYLSFAPAGFRSFRKSMPLWTKKKLFLRRTLERGLGEGFRAPILFLDHHESHAASAFFPSPFDEAAILTLDGVGEWSTTSIGKGAGHRIELTHHIQFPHSIGMLYSAFTYYCGFEVNSGEYKLMGLAPYGEPRYKDTILQHLVDLEADGSFWLDMDCFDYCQGLTMTSPRFHQLFGGPPREPGSKLEQRHMDLAASIQVVTEEIMMRIARHVHATTAQKNLVLGGGVALNCVANGRLLREGPFERVWIQPAAGDAGGALGAALFTWYQLLENPRQARGADAQKGSLLGPRFSREEVRSFLDGKNASYQEFATEDALLDHVAGCVQEEKVVGWFHGRMEFGPRALGARSIVGDARSRKIQATMNLKIKLRESFRPFAPCVLREHVHEWFAMRPMEESPYMTLVAPVLDEHRVPLSDEERCALRSDPDLMTRVNIARSSVPAVTHVDYSARVQTVDERHGRFQRLMQKFFEKTGCPILVNTSFNLSWEPIVCAPKEAFDTFMQSEMDVLVLEDFVLPKAQQRLGFQGGFAEGPSSAPDATAPWADPSTGEPLVVTASAALNPTTGRSYPVEDGIPRLFVPTSDGDAGGEDVTEMVRQFYEETPFPNYDDLDDRRALMEKARKSPLARKLNEEIPYHARVLEVGCGTGQLTNYLSTSHRSVLGIDLCLNSLRLAQKFKVDQRLTEAVFAQMNLFRPGLRDGFFDVVISNGVLHHTSDCRGAFRRIGRLVRPGGYLVVGLYNTYSRALHHARRSLYRRTGLIGGWMDPHFGRVGSEGKHAAWFKDQYCHPHETSHSLGEVFRWLLEDGLDFVSSIPGPEPGVARETEAPLFEPRAPGSGLGRILAQIADMGSGIREGGFFVVVSRRREEVRA
jgi:carbamoyltransferase